MVARPRARPALLLFALLLAASSAFLPVARTQVSKPVAKDEDLEVDEDNTYLQREAVESKTAANTSDEEPLPNQACSVDLELSWVSEVSSSIYATPLITDLFSDGRKDVIVPTFVHYLEALDAEDGSRLPGWPTNHRSQVHASPLLYDCDFDGVKDILIATYDGELICYKDTGEQLDTFQLPALPVKQNWYVGLGPDPNDHNNPDVGDAPGEGGNETLTEQERVEAGVQGKGMPSRPDAQDGVGEGGVEEDSEEEALLAMSEGDPTVDGGEAGGVDDDDGRAARRRALLQRGSANGAGDPGPLVFSEPDPSAENTESFEVFGDDEAEESSAEGDEGEAGLPDMYDDEYYGYDPTEYGNGRFDDGELDREFEEGDYDYGEHHLGDEDDDLAGYLSVDPHVLCTPAVGDIDGDGRDEVVVGVTYMFDQEYYSKPEHRSMLGDDVDISKYIASGVVAVDMHRMAVKWEVHLDLTTYHTKFRAYVYSAPTLADVNGDGNMEIVVGTSVGFVYVLDKHGATLPGWPVQMGEVQAQVVVEDVDDDGSLEVLACDARGNVAAFDASGQEKWEVHLGALVSSNPTVGDVNGDGRTEVVVGTGDGKIHVLDGRSGGKAQPFLVSAMGRRQSFMSRTLISLQFPVETNAMIMSSVLLAKVNPDEDHLHMVTMSFDGFLYLVDGKTGCMDVVDVGENAYAMVLFDDVDNDGFMDLLVSTMNGYLYCYKTRARYDPLSSWPRHVQASNGFAARSGNRGVRVAPHSRRMRDVGGQALQVTFDIVDRLIPNTESEDLKGLMGPYKVVVKLVGVGVEAMNKGESPVVGISSIFSSPGTYTLEVPCPRSRTTGTVEVTMTDKWGKTYTDSFSLTFHMSFYRVLKWMLALPTVAMFIVVIRALPVDAMRAHLPS